MYYPKYYYELNYIEHFWYSTKKWVKKNYQYILKNFQCYIFCALASVLHKMILVYNYYQ